MNEEFYIGYLDNAPPKTSRFLKHTALLLTLAAITVGGIMVAIQQPFYPSHFEFLQYRSFEGQLIEHPYPQLRIQLPGKSNNAPVFTRYHLVNEGKWGLDAEVAGLDKQQVELQGALIYRDNQVMIEVVPETIKAKGRSPLPAQEPHILGTFTFAGEIVDSKCFLGVMNPGQAKPHKACATRCISGGVPPILFFKDENNHPNYLTLQTAEGEAINQHILDLVAEPVSVKGQVQLIDNQLVLRAEEYRRIESD